MAINKPALVEALFGAGNAEPAKNLIPPTMWSYDDATVDDEYDPDKAKEILAANGVTELDHLGLGSCPFVQPELRAFG